MYTQRAFVHMKGRIVTADPSEGQEARRVFNSLILTEVALEWCYYMLVSREMHRV